MVAKETYSVDELIGVDHLDNETLNSLKKCQLIISEYKKSSINYNKIYNFLDYYLPFTTRIVTKYIEAESKKEKTFVENKLILKMSVYIKEVEHECDRLLEEIVKSKDKELDFEMKVFEKTSDLDINEDELKGSEKNV